jgi:hypothetical protein
MKYVRHQPGYTPEKAASRRRLREIARRIGIKPRALNRKFRNPLYSSAKLHMEFLFDTLKQSLKLPFDEFGKLAGFHSGGIIAQPYQRPIIDILAHEHHIPLDMVKRLPKVECEPVTMKLSTITEIKINVADLPADDDPCMVKIRDMIEQHQRRMMEQLRLPAEYLTPRPRGMAKLKTGDLS